MGAVMVTARLAVAAAAPPGVMVTRPVGLLQALWGPFSAPATHGTLIQTLQQETVKMLEEAFLPSNPVLP